MSDSCLFCRIVRGEIPAKIIAENSHAIAFRDIDPKSPVHVLVVPRRHVASLSESSDGVELGELLLLAAKVARDEHIDGSGYRCVINTGADGAQSVHHLHVHVLGGRQMGWPPG
jgi:histidine triad (HIT) family protein